MYFNVSRRQMTAATLKKCSLCGAALPVPAGQAEAAESLCATCARPVKLGGAHANVARVMSEPARR